VRRFADAIAGLRGGARVRAEPRRCQAGLHRILEASERSVAIQRFIALLGEAAERVAKTAAAGQTAAAVRSDVSADALGGLLVTLAFGFIVSVEVGIPFDAAAARDAVLALVAPPGRKDAPEIPG
jgi:hypothetical protein